MSDEKKCPYCGAVLAKYFTFRFACGTSFNPHLDGRYARGGKCYESELAQVKAERDRLAGQVETLRKKAKTLLNRARRFSEATAKHAQLSPTTWMPSINALRRAETATEAALAALEAELSGWQRRYGH